MRGALQQRNGWRGAFLALTFLALLMKVAAPQGFMVAAAGPSGGFPLVICTGHGPLTTQTSDSKGGKSQTKSEAPCAFAGHAAPLTPETGVQIVGSTFVQEAEATAIRPDLVPGRGLAAPPPPSQGPPLLL